MPGIADDDRELDCGSCWTRDSAIGLPFDDSDNFCEATAAESVMLYADDSKPGARTFAPTEL